MRSFTVILMLAFACSRLLAQQEQYVFEAVKYKIIDYGQQKQSATVSPVRVTLSLRDSTISLKNANSEILDYTRFRHDFHIRRNVAAVQGIQVYVTREGFVFTIDPKLRTIVISKEEVKPQYQALWLEEIEVR